VFATKPLSVIILTLNEETSLPDCLASIAELNADIYVVDSGSADRTQEIARQAGCQVFEHPFENYAAQRNWALDNLPLKTKWLLCLDADERLTAEVAQEIVSAVSASNPLHMGYMLNRRTIFMGKWIRHGGQYPSYHLRLFQNGHGRCENRLYDQHFVAQDSIGKLQHDYINVLTSDLTVWTDRHNYWATLEANEIMAQRKQPKTNPTSNTVQGRFFGSAIERKRFLRTEIYQRFPLFVRPFLFWVYGYIFRLGFLDGIPGLIFHTLQRFWFRFLVDAKLYELKLRKGRHGDSE